MRGTELEHKDGFLLRVSTGLCGKRRVDSCHANEVSRGLDKRRGLRGRTSKSGRNLVIADTFYVLGLIEARSVELGRGPI